MSEAPTEDARTALCWRHAGNDGAIADNGAIDDLLLCGRRFRCADNSRATGYDVGVIFQLL